MQTLRQEVNRLLDRRLFSLFLIMVAFWIVCAVEWTQKVAGQMPDPRFWTLLSLFITIYGGIQVFRLRLRPDRRQEHGRGEVAKILDQVGASSFISYHDLAHDGFKIDHVIV